MKQAVAVLGFGAYAFLFPYFVLVVMAKFMRVRTSLEEEKSGVDITLHGEEAYLET